MTALAAAVLLFSAAAAPPKVQPIGPAPESGVPAAVRSALEPNGVRLTLPEGAFCELWLRKSIPGLTLSTAVGVIRFLAPAADFRGQSIRPGIYTLRYAQPPSDGSHMGVSEYPDFLLVIPAGDDPDPDAIFKFAELLDLSRKATRTRHPGVFNLTRASGKSFPAAATDDWGRVVLQVKARSGSGGNVPIALVVKGQAEQ